ncbi:hypothetical protein EV368DRAFT_85180 [Lentinula lateritia]|uniref:Uncharacterized protein n=1 Tax=Lentinula aff. lateritia TaxID=2804960 RepID=A0ACC1TR65_9AGAR|nr:hypothetical protein F5876DRAFT_80280 [Lentinula aff. lateritia]KAJ3849799.1 hypothetical protein EV368DRAFT_85180 [Lentinula lateritia]
MSPFRSSSSSYRFSPTSMPAHHLYSNARRRSHSLPPQIPPPTQFTTSSVTLLPTVGRSLPPASYDPTKPINDQFAVYDPDMVSCEFYAEQLHFNFTDKMLLATFDIDKQEYVSWTGSDVGLYNASWPACKAGPFLPSTATTCLMAFAPNLGTPSKSSEELPTIPTLTKALPATLSQRPIIVTYTPCKPTSPCKTGVAGSTVHGAAILEDSDFTELGNGFLATEDTTFNTDNLCYSHTDLLHALPTEGEDHDWHSSPNGCPLFSITPGALKAATIPSPSRGKTRAWYTEEQAMARKNTDSDLMSTIVEAAELGTYHEEPHLHPAFSVRSISQTPDALKQFHGVGASQLAWRHMGHSRGSTVGTLILMFNGVVGITLEQFAELRKRFHKCPSCLTYFSFEGYQRHIEYDMRCQNTPLLEPVPNLRGVFDSLPDIPVRKWPAGTTPVREDVVNTPVGLAWLTWNSPAGITHDTWVHLITAWRQCKTCGLVRSFEGHARHLQEHKKCVT